MVDAMNIQPIKECGCGAVWFQIPKDAKLFHCNDPFDGYYWDCFCGSTQFIPLRKVQYNEAKTTPKP